MTGTSKLSTLLANLAPVVSSQAYVFLTRPNGAYGAGAELAPLATFAEKEGLTLIVPKEHADAAGENYDGEFALISLSVHSDLQAIGLTAAVTGALADRGISANVVAAFYHDHLFVPFSRAEEAVAALLKLSTDNQL